MISRGNRFLSPNAEKSILNETSYAMYMRPILNGKEQTASGAGSGIIKTRLPDETDLCSDLAERRWL